MIQTEKYTFPTPNLGFFYTFPTPNRCIFYTFPIFWSVTEMPYYGVSAPTAT